jgi:hypothetical protein
MADQVRFASTFLGFFNIFSIYILHYFDVSKAHILWRFAAAIFWTPESRVYSLESDKKNPL